MKDLEIQRQYQATCLGCDGRDCKVKAMFETLHKGNYCVVLLLDCLACGRTNKMIFSESDDALDKAPEIFTAVVSAL